MITINLIRQNGGVIAGQKKSVDIWTHGGIVTITDETEIKLIGSWIRAAAKWQPKEYETKTEMINNYVSYMLDQYDIL